MSRVEERVDLSSPATGTAPEMIATGCDGSAQVGIPDTAAPAPRVDRRGFLREVALSTARLATEAAVVAGALLGTLRLNDDNTELAGLRGDLGLLRPPGSADEADFLALCTRCTRCADACEAGCIRLFGPEAGSLHGTPYIVPEEVGCTMCLQCGPACPSEAIVTLARREDVDMGVAVVDERLCVSHNGTGVCGACHTACPLRNRALIEDYRNAPRIVAEACTGCGLCEELCIVHDRRAIQVVSRRGGTRRGAVT